MGPCANTDLGYVQSITDSFQWRHEKLPGKCEHQTLQTRCFQTLKAKCKLSDSLYDGAETKWHFPTQSRSQVLSPIRREGEERTLGTRLSPKFRPKIIKNYKYFAPVFLVLLAGFLTPAAHHQSYTVFKYMLTLERTFSQKAIFCTPLLRISINMTL